MREHIPDIRGSVALVRSSEYAAKRKTWRVDLYSPSLNLVIEYDGELWHLPSIFPGGVEKGNAVVARDLAKTADLVAQGFRVMRVRTGKLERLTENDLLMPRHVSGALVAEALFPHLESLGFLMPVDCVA